MVHRERPEILVPWQLHRCLRVLPAAPPSCRRVALGVRVRGEWECKAHTSAKKGTENQRQAFTLQKCSEFAGLACSIKGIFFQYKKQPRNISCTEGEGSDVQQVFLGCTSLVMYH